MKIKFDTSINIDKKLLTKVEEYARILKLKKQDIILKVLEHFIKLSKCGIFIKDRTVGYQFKSGNYKKLTLHLDLRELEIFRQIRVVTLLSTSFVFFIAMDLFGYKLFNKAKKSEWTSRCIRNYSYSGNYPEYSLFIKKTLTLFRYWISYT
jgi:hypothetical protein